MSDKHGFIYEVTAVGYRWRVGDSTGTEPFKVHGGRQPAFEAARDAGYRHGAKTLEVTPPVALPQTVVAVKIDGNVYGFYALDEECLCMNHKVNQAWDEWKETWEEDGYPETDAQFIDWLVANKPWALDNAPVVGVEVDHYS